MDNDKIEVPEDLSAPDPEFQPKVENDPEVLAEIKKNRLLHLKLERWKETAGAIGVVLQTFKAEAMSLTSGIGTLVVGWFQIRRWVARGRAETKAEGRVMGRAEGRIAGREAERAERREDRRERPLSETRTSGSGYGSGSGRLGASKEASAMLPPPPPGGELMPPPESVMATSMSSYLDPMNYVTVAVPVVFIWSTVVMWLKRKRKQAIEGGRRNAD